MDSFDYSKSIVLIKQLWETNIIETREPMFSMSTFVIEHIEKNGSPMEKSMIDKLKLKWKTDLREYLINLFSVSRPYKTSIESIQSIFKEYRSKFASHKILSEIAEKLILDLTRGDL